MLQPGVCGAGPRGDVAYYLVHSMGRGGGATTRGPRGRAGVCAHGARGGGRAVVYLGGLGDQPRSEHLRSRHETALALARGRPAADLLPRRRWWSAPQSESYRTLRYLVERLPAMIAPAWLKNATQPIAIDDVLDYLAQAPAVDASAGREIQIGGPDVLSYGEMLDRMAEVLGIRRRPKLPVPLLTPWLSSLWIGLVTPSTPACAAADRGARRPHGRHRPLRNGAVRHRAGAVGRDAGTARAEELAATTSP